MNNIITCPHCSKEFELSAAISADLREHLEQDLKQKFAKDEQRLQKNMDALEAKEKSLAKRETQIRKQAQEEAEKLLEEKLKAGQESLDKKREELRRRETEMQEKIDAELKTRLEKGRGELERKIREEMTVELSDLRGELQQKQEKIKQLSKQELELRKEREKLREQREEMDLELQRAKDEIYRQVREDLQRKADEEQNLKLQEKDKKIADLTRMLDEMKRKAEQGSMQTQGEVLERDVEAALRESFPYDTIEPVKTGQRGADIHQRVYTSDGKECGLILWEIKNAKNWGSDWISKLKENSRQANADVAIIASRALPADKPPIYEEGGIVVCRSELAAGLATILRQKLVALRITKDAAVGQDEKVKALIEYLTGAAFRQRVQAIVDAFSVLQDQLVKEKKQMIQHWAQREKLLQQMIDNTAGLQGDVKGLLRELPEPGSDRPALPEALKDYDHN